MIEFETLGLAGLALSAFTSATLLPGTSEAVLTALMATGTYGLIVMLAVATVGNVAGSCVNWWLGKQAERFRDRRWFPASEEQLDRARAWYKRYGWWSLILSWMPVIGDPLTLAAGVMNERFSRFVIIVSIAKFARYLAVALTVRTVLEVI